MSEDTIIGGFNLNKIKQQLPFVTENSLKVLTDRYLAKCEDKFTETPYNMFERVAREISKVDEEPSSAYIDFLELMTTGKFMPNSPTLMNAGKEGSTGLYSACFVLPIHDSLESILETQKAIGHIQAAGGGTGFCLDELRPSGDYIRSSGGTTSGPISFWRTYCTTTDAIQQGCVVGETLIATVNGQEPISSLVGTRPYVFCFDTATQEYTVKQADAVFKTGVNKEVYKLKTDKGLDVIATPDHLFLCRDNIYRPLKDLKPGMKLMPFIRHTNYRVNESGVKVAKENIITYGYGERTRQHILVYRTLFGDIPAGKCVHHKDGNHFNDNPDNLELLTQSEHMKLHTLKLVENNGHPFQLNRFSHEGEKNGMHASSSFWKDEEKVKAYREKMSELKKNSPNPMHNPEHLKKFKESRKGLKYERSCNIEDSMTKRSRGLVLEALAQVINETGSCTEAEWETKKQTLIKQYRVSIEKINKLFGSFSNALAELSKTNHEIISIEPAGHADVYDMTVPDVHNFVICENDKIGSSGAVAHNSYRRGANMMMMGTDHPDIIKFLFAKQNPSQFTNYNISIKVSDEFMETLKTTPDKPVCVKNPRTGASYYIPKDVVSRCEAAVVESINNQARFNALDTSYSVKNLHLVDESESWDSYITHGELFDLIVKHAWTTGEPGLFFIDKVNAVNPTSHIGKIQATNPCGEQPLLPWESCNLGSLNLAYYVKENYLLAAIKSGDPEFEYEPLSQRVDWKQLETDIYTAVRFLDNVIAANQYPLQQIHDICHANRKIGLGVMGFADALFKLGIPYNSKTALSAAKRFMKFVNEKAIQASIELAKLRGTFPNYKGSRWEEKGLAVRNADITTCAPTGTISIIADCSCGIEPIFNLVFVRNVLNGKQLVEVNSYFKEVMEHVGLWTPENIDLIARTGTITSLSNIPEEIRKVFVSARDVSPEQHVKMQAAFQQHVTNGISKTINMPTEATEEDVRNVYMLAHALNCKGITVYRDGCRKGQPMALKKAEQTTSSESTHDLEPISVPPGAPAFRLTRETVFGSLHVNIVYDPETGKELEVFAQLGRGGEHVGATLEGMCRLTSMWLRSGGDIGTVVKQLVGIGSNVLTKSNKVTSLPNELALTLIDFCELKESVGISGLANSDTLKKHWESKKPKRKTVKKEEKSVQELKKCTDINTSSGTKAKCPTPGCNGSIIYQEGCSICLECKVSRC